MSNKNNKDNPPGIINAMIDSVNDKLNKCIEHMIYDNRRIDLILSRNKRQCEVNKIHIERIVKLEKKLRKDKRVVFVVADDKTKKKLDEINKRLDKLEGKG